MLLRWVEYLTKPLVQQRYLEHFNRIEVLELSCALHLRSKTRCKNPKSSAACKVFIKHAIVMQVNMFQSFIWLESWWEKRVTVSRCLTRIFKINFCLTVGRRATEVIRVTHLFSTVVCQPFPAEKWSFLLWKGAWAEIAWHNHLFGSGEYSQTATESPLCSTACTMARSAWALIPQTDSESVLWDAATVWLMSFIYSVHLYLWSSAC